MIDDFGFVNSLDLIFILILIKIKIDNIFSHKPGTPPPQPESIGISGCSSEQKLFIDSRVMILDYVGTIFHKSSNHKTLKRLNPQPPPSHKKKKKGLQMKNT